MSQLPEGGFFRMLPYYLSGLLWWQWMLSAAGFLAVSALSYVLSMTGESGTGAKSTFLVLVFGFMFWVSVIASFVCAVFGMMLLGNLNMNWFRR